MADLRAARRAAAEDVRLERVGVGEPAPAHAPGVLQIPTVHIVELGQVLILTRYQPDGANGRSAAAEQDDIAGLDFGSKSTNVAAPELGVVAIRPPRASIAGADEGYALFEKDIGIGSVGRAA